MNSCRALPQQQQLHGLHLFSDWQQRLQPELISEGLGPAGAVQQAGFGEVHRCLPAARGRVEWEPLTCSVVEWLKGWQSMESVSPPLLANISMLTCLCGYPRTLLLIYCIYSIKWNCCYFQIDLQTFLTLTDQDLKELGITTFGARRKMLLAISGTNQEECDFPAFYSLGPALFLHCIDQISYFLLLQATPQRSPTLLRAKHVLHLAEVISSANQWVFNCRWA